MNVNWRQPPESFLDEVEVRRVYEVANLLNLGDCVAIDSYSMQADGPAVTSVFLISGGFLVEVKIDRALLEFDIASNRALVNYRVEFGAIRRPAENSANDATTTEQPPQEAVTEFVKVTLRHTDHMVSGLSFFGKDTGTWLSYVLAAYPKELLLR